MLNPVHPGIILREEVLKANDLRQDEVAKRLQVTQANLNRVLTGKAALSTEMALKFEHAFGISADLMVRVQASYNLAQARQQSAEIIAGIERFQPAA